MVALIDVSQLRLTSAPFTVAVLSEPDLVWSSYSECWMTPEERRAEIEEMSP